MKALLIHNDLYMAVLVGGGMGLIGLTYHAPGYAALGLAMGGFSLIYKRR